MSGTDPTEKNSSTSLLPIGAHYRLLVEGITDHAIFMLDTDGIVVSWNAGAERIKGYRADEIIGQHFSKFYCPEDISRREPWTGLEIAKSEGRFEDEGWRIRKDGSRMWASVVITALRDSNAKLVGFAKITRDITERRRMAHAEAAFIRKLDQSSLDDQLRQVQKMEAVERLAGGVAHEFNNLFTVILSYTDMLLEELAPQDPRADDLGEIRKATVAAASLTRELLAFSLQQGIEPQLVNSTSVASARTSSPAVEL